MIHNKLAAAPQLKPLTRGLLLAAVLGTCLPAIADEQSDRIKALEARLETSLKLIEQLTARVNSVEQGKGGTVAGAPNTEQAQALAALQANVAQLNESLRTYP